MGRHKDTAAESCSACLFSPPWLPSHTGQVWPLGSCDKGCSNSSTLDLLSLAPLPTQAMEDLEWRPEFGLLDGLKDSYDKDFGRGNFRKAANFKTDNMILEKVKSKTLVRA